MRVNASCCETCSSTKSTIAQQALSEFVAREDAGIEETNIINTIRIYLKTPEGEEMVRDIVRRSIIPEGPKTPKPNGEKRFYGVSE